MKALVFPTAGHRVAGPVRMPVSWEPPGPGSFSFPAAAALPEVSERSAGAGIHHSSPSWLSWRGGWEPLPTHCTWVSSLWKLPGAAGQYLGLLQSLWQRSQGMCRWKVTRKNTHLSHTAPGTGGGGQT